MAMDWAGLFRIANMAAMVGWVLLIFLPRWPWLMMALRALILVFCVAYATLAFVYFYRVEGGGFGSLAAVATLFSSQPVLLAGWVHYLAFDLFVGAWIAERADARRMSRLVQAPILATTFMFGPVGFLIYAITEWIPRKTAAATA